MRDRLLMPILIPLGVAAFIALVIFSAGEILLSISASLATALALVLALLIMVVCWALAAGPRVPTTQISLAAGLPLAAILGVGLFLAVQPQESTGEGHGGAAGGAAVATSLTEIATDNKFSSVEYTVPANTEITMEFANRGAAVHNWHVTGVTDKGGGNIATQLLAGGKTESLKFTIDKTGAYPFLCDVHPGEMKGTLNVVDAPAGGAPAAGAGGAVAGTAIIGTDNKFDRTQLSVKANEPATVTFQNRGSALHNWHVTGVTDTAGKPVATQLIAGGRTEVITFTIAQPGTYDYLCDVHPAEMRGKLTVQ